MTSLNTRIRVYITFPFLAARTHEAATMSDIVQEPIVVVSDPSQVKVKLFNRWSFDDVQFCSSFNPACPALSKVPHVLVLRRGWLALREANLKIGFCTNRHGQFHLGHTIQRPCFSYILEEYERGREKSGEQKWQREVNDYLGLGLQFARGVCLASSREKISGCNKCKVLTVLENSEIKRDGGREMLCET
ncbi:hypothetical protein P8452_47325 [Trifolium repens]|nr:hypothetical protein P8452_47325 [Trifolium repens]